MEKNELTIRKISSKEMEDVQGGVLWLGAAIGGTIGAISGYRNGGWQGAVTGGIFGAASGFTGGLAGATTGFVRAGWATRSVATGVISSELA